MASIVYISENRVRELLNWEETYKSIKCALESVSKERAFQDKRSAIKLGNTYNFLFSMCGGLSDKTYGGLGCKLFTYFPENFRKNEPALKANIFLLDEETGSLKAVIAAAHITDWRTAAASAVATKYLHSENNNVLAILGAGSQGKAHAMAFKYLFNFNKINIWNRTTERAKNVVDELNQNNDNTSANKVFVAYDSIKECVKDADVIVTATSGNETLLKLEWLKKGVHINAVRVNPVYRELEDDIYKSSDVYIDYWEGAKYELEGIKDLGVEFKGQIGDVIARVIAPPSSDRISVFQSLGMPVEDCAVARLVYDLHIASNV
ncbi:hypothetical protein ILUMI_01573 [Ignelater luminosus]|uniref:Ketimine reductase mu-crystallin n=1 Tax=Ignelater luminosus TaxID=2038154 RepID=A0A8K0DI28_IGNLU|nr:hypothetical protein ILUMI_01573 [Ignelater luminosus]